MEQVSKCEHGPMALLLEILEQPIARSIIDAEGVLKLSATDKHMRTHVYG